MLTSEQESVEMKNNKSDDVMLSVKASRERERERASCSVAHPRITFLKPTTAR